MADALGNSGEFSVLTYFFHFGISQLFDRRPWTGMVSFNPVGGVGRRKSIQLNNLESLFNCIDWGGGGGGREKINTVKRS